MSVDARRGAVDRDVDGAGAPTRLARALAEAGGGAVSAVLLYGSHRLGLAREHSAVDLVALVSAYRPFYRGLAGAGHLPRPPWLMSAAARFLPPNVIAFTPEGERGPIAKVLVVDEAHFRRALGERPADHFLLGRMIQDVAPLWWADDETRARVEHLLAEARAGVIGWSAPFLPESFDAESLGLRLLEVLYSSELRPEAEDRAHQVFEVQRAHFRATLQPVLEAEAAAGRLASEGEGRFRLVERPGTWSALRWRLHFLRSKLRSTARWGKHVVTFANWLPYVVRKVERHTGEPIELTRLERRWPLVFLWPRAIKVLASRPPGAER